MGALGPQRICPPFPAQQNRTKLGEAGLLNLRFLTSLLELFSVQDVCRGTRSLPRALVLNFSFVADIPSGADTLIPLGLHDGKNAVTLAEYRRYHDVREILAEGKACNVSNAVKDLEKVCLLQVWPGVFLEVIQSEKMSDGML